MTANKNNIKESDWQGISNDFIIQTSNILEDSKVELGNIKVGNSENLNVSYYRIERQISKVSENVMTKYISPSAFNRLSSLFENLVNIKKELESYLNTESYKEFKAFYSDVDYKLDSEKLIENIEPNPFRENQLNTLNSVMKIKDVNCENDINLKTKNNKNKTWFKVGVELAKGEIDRIKKAKEKWDWDEITLELFPIEKTSTFRPYVSESWANRQNTKSTQKNIFTRTNSDEEIDEIIIYCIQQGYTIKHPLFREREKFYPFQK